MFKIELQTIRSGYDRETCWVHARPGIIPGDTPIIVVTMQKLLLTGSDVFFAINDMRSDDNGQTWTGPTPHPETLGRRIIQDSIEEGVCDLWPMWHAKTRKLLATGQNVVYSNDEMPAFGFPKSTTYSVYKADDRTWTHWAKLKMPESMNFAAGCTQRFDLPNGNILLPTYGIAHGSKPKIHESGWQENQYTATVVKCAFDGENLTYLEHGTELTIPTGRGFPEPSLTYVDNKFFLTLRNDDAGYVTSSEDGLSFCEPRKWTFDDGNDLGNYNTQQHWITHADDLYLIYTRRGAKNDHVFRHRAPLFIAQVDKKRLCIIRATEQILVPERGARLGNFGVTKISDDESWVVASEWMQTNGPNFSDSTVCEKHGSDNSIFLAKVRWDK